MKASWTRALQATKDDRNKMIFDSDEDQEDVDEEQKV